MMRSIATLPTIVLDPCAAVALYQQLYEGLRTVILNGSLPAGTQLPATRMLARELGVSRNTVVNAFEQLSAEGYVEGKVGSGTYVSHALPDMLLHSGQRTDRVSDAPAHRQLSRRGQMVATIPVSVSYDQGAPRAFRPGIPALDAFPFDIWATLSARYWRKAGPALLGYGEAAGYRPLREAIAEYLQASRGVHCTPDQVIIVTGSQQGLDIAARVLLDVGDAVWVEEPGYAGARGALMSAGARLVPVPVDGEGLDVAAGVAACATARLAYVTPSHQYPLGVTMSLPRRLALLEWARHAGAWVLEDDYDSEYRYTSRPLPAIQGLDTERRTLYVGTLSKVLLPALRLGYVVVPEDLVAAFVNARALLDRHGPTIEQAVLAAFIREGHFARHIRRMRALYAQRQSVLIEAVTRDLRGMLDVQVAGAGMHVLGWLPAGVDDRLVSRYAADQGLEVPALSAYGMLPQRRGGLVLGYAAIEEPQIRAGIQRLADVLRSALRFSMSMSDGANAGDSLLGTL